MSHSSRRSVFVGAFVTAAIFLVGCSQSSAPVPSAAQQQAQAQSAAASRDLDTYRQLLRIKNDEMTVSMGKDIVNRFPDSAAAKEVQQTLPAVEKRYNENSEKNRLAALWLYQVSPMEGGTQSTAVIENTDSSGNAHVRLILRQHTSWGQSVFLYGQKPGFVCRGNCTIDATVDGKSIGIKAFKPPTGEPALMIRDDTAFIKMLEKAKKISLNVILADGNTKQTLVYEVAGFVPSKWAALPKPEKKKHR